MECNDPVGESLFAIRDRSSSPPYRIELQVNDRPLSMEVDTGAAVSLAPCPTYYSLRSYSPQESSSRRTQANRYPSWAPWLSPSHTADSTGLKLLVVKGTGSCLMGHDWLKVIRLEDHRQSEYCPNHFLHPGRSSH